MHEAVQKQWYCKDERGGLWGPPEMWWIVGQRGIVGGSGHTRSKSWNSTLPFTTYQPANLCPFLSSISSLSDDNERFYYLLWGIYFKRDMKQSLRWGTLEYSKWYLLVPNRSPTRGWFYATFYINVEANAPRHIFRLTEVPPVEGMVSNTRTYVQFHGLSCAWVSTGSNKNHWLFAQFRILAL